MDNKKHSPRAPHRAILRAQAEPRHIAMKIGARKATAILFTSSLVFLGLVFAAQSRAEDGITNIINGTTVNSPATYIVGTNGSLNALIITNAGRMTVTGNGVIGNSAISNSNNVWVTGAGSVWSNSGNLDIGSTGKFNQLSIINGGQVFDYIGFIGRRSGASNNSVTVSGAGSVWSNSLNIIVGSSGYGNSLTIANGAQVINTATGSIGDTSTALRNSVLVTGNGSLWNNGVNLYVGWSGSRNSLIISNGGHVLSKYADIGRNNGANYNMMVVTGAGSVWSNWGGSPFSVGDAGSGNSLTISDGGQVFNSGNFDIGWDINASNNSVLVTGPGSVLTNDYFLRVGNMGAGCSLIVSNGGQVISRGGYIGYSASNTTVLVTGPGSIWTVDGTLFVNFNYNNPSNNQLILTSGGTVLVTTNILIGDRASYGASITVAGGNLFATNATATGVLDIRRGTFVLNSGTVVVNRLYATNVIGSVMNFNGGLLRSGYSSVSNGVAFTVGDGVQSATLDLNGGTHSFANGLLLSSNAMLVGNGTIFGAATNFGEISPGHSAGLLAFSGDLTLMDSSVLTMEVGGPTTNDYDRIVVNGFLRIGGLLNVVFTNGYAPSPGDVFDLFSYGTNSGSFSQTNLPTFQYAGTDWDTSHLLAPSSDPLSGSLIFIPEPSSIGLLLASAGVICRRQRRPGTARKQPPC